MESISSVLQVQQLYIQIELAQENIEISKERLEYSIYRKESGVGNSIEVNAAQVDLGTDSLALIQLETSLKKELNRLKLLLGVDMDTQLKIKNEIPVPVLGSAEELGESVKSNTQILISQLNELVALENTKLANSRRLPVLGMNINYGYNSSQNGAGIILSQQTDGFSGSASLSIPIFNGLQLATAIKNAQIQEQIAGISNQYTELQIQQLLNDAILDQSLLEESILLQEKREKLATLNVSRSLEAFKNGQLRFTEVRENQLNLLQSRMAINQSRLSLVLLRYQILRLTGKLLN
jgi:outer membrane protein TolC